MASESLAWPGEVAFNGCAVVTFKGGQTGFEQLSSGHHDHIVPAGDLVSTENLSYQTFSSVSPDGPAKLLRGGDAKAPDVAPSGQDEERAVSAPNAGTALVDLLEITAAADPLAGAEPARHGQVRYSLLTVRRLRPFARRRFSTSLPFFELIRTRNPCAFLRRRVLG